MNLIGRSTMLWKLTPKAPIIHCLRSSRLWTPDYLILGETKTPEYDEVNVQIKGYDFVVLEKFQSFIHGLANNMDIQVKNCWAQPAQKLKVQRLKPKSSVVETDFLLNLYERNVQVVDTKCHILPVFIEAVITACPPGVNISVHEDTDEIQDARYIPDLEIRDLQERLNELGGPVKR